MSAWRWWRTGWALAFVVAGCASIIDFDEPFDQSGGAASTSSTAQGGSGGAISSATSSATTSTSASCVPQTSCQEVGFTCGTVFNGCADEDCGTCTAPFVCGDGVHACICPGQVTVNPTLVADTAIQNNASWLCGALTAGASPCINISQYLSDARGLLRFTIDAATQKALATPGSVLSAKLTLRPAAMCESISFTPQGKVQVYVLRNDWDETNARWCHRAGPQGDSTTHPWGTQGANDPVLDHGELAAEMDMPTDNMPFDVPLDPAKLVSKLVKGNELSFLVLTPPGSVLVIQTKEGGAPTTLGMDYCPFP